MTDKVPDADLVMACRIRSVMDVKLEMEFKALARKYDVDGKMVYLNTVEDMPLLMASCDVGFLPGRHNMVKVLEIPLVILEMSGLAKPFVFGNVEPLGELAERGIGVFPESNTEKEYISLLARFLTDEKYACISGEKARNSVLDTFTISAQAQEFEKIYYDLMIWRDK